MINYLQLGRNLRKFVPRVPADSATYIYNSKGIYDFKQLNPKINEALTNSLKDINNPFLEIHVKNKKHPIGTITIKDGCEEVSQDTFRLQAGENIEDYLPETDGCLKKLIFNKKGIAEIGKQYDLLKKFLEELTLNLKKPKLEFWMKEKSKYTIGNVVLKDGDTVITRGYFSKTNNEKTPIEKFHFINEHELISGYGFLKDRFSKINKRLPKKLVKRLWMLDERAKSMVKKKYGIGCSPKTSDEIAKEWNLTGARVRDILKTVRIEMELADTYNKQLNHDLDNLSNILSEKERYDIYRTGSSVDINKAEYKIIKHKQALKKLMKEKLK